MYKIHRCFSETANRVFLVKILSFVQGGHAASKQ